MPSSHPDGQLSCSKIDWTSFSNSVPTTMADLWPTPEMNMVELRRFAAEFTSPISMGEQQRTSVGGHGRVDSGGDRNDSGMASKPGNSATTTSVRNSAPSSGSSVLSRCVRPLTVIVTAVADTLPPLMHTPLNDWAREVDRSLIKVNGAENPEQMQIKVPHSGAGTTRGSLRRLLSQKPVGPPTSKLTAATSDSGKCNLTRAGNKRKRVSPLQLAEKRKSEGALGASTDDLTRLDSNGGHYRPASSRLQRAAQDIDVVDWAFRSNKARVSEPRFDPCCHATIDGAMSDIARDRYPSSAIAVDDYTADRDDSNELSFKVGITPPNFLQLASDHRASPVQLPATMDSIETAVIGLTAGPGRKVAGGRTRTCLGFAVLIDIRRSSTV